MLRTKKTRRNSPLRGMALLTLTTLLVAPTLAGPPDIGPQSRSDAGGIAAANETSIAASDFAPGEVVATWNDYRVPGEVRCGVAFSEDAGRTWTDFIYRPSPAFQSNVEGDPMTAYDHRDGTLYIGAIAFFGNGGIYVGRRDAGAASFGPAVMARQSGSADKGWMSVGPDPAFPGDITRSKLYVAYNEGLISSSDRGQTWTPPRSLGTGLGFLPRVASNGDLFVAYWDAGDQLLLRRSFDGGATISAPLLIAMRMDFWSVDGSRFPGSFRAPPLLTFAVDPNDETLYIIYPDTTSIAGGNYNVDLYFTRSTDLGVTWDVPRVINGDSFLPPGDQFFPWLEVDRNGRLHLLFYDTRNTTSNDNAASALIKPYYSYSDNRGDTWTEAALMAQPFNSELDGRLNPPAFIGDYLGLAVGGGFAYPCYLSNQNGDSDIFVHRISVCPGDLDGDGVTALSDLGLLLSCWQAPCADLDGDNNTTLSDLGLLLAAWGCDAAAR